MQFTLKGYILSLMLDPHVASKLDPKVYQTVISTLDSKEYLDDMLSHIFRTVEEKYLLERIAPTDMAILKFLTPEYCIERAYEYLVYVKKESTLLAEREKLAR